MYVQQRWYIKISEKFQSKKSYFSYCLIDYLPNLFDHQHLLASPMISINIVLRSECLCPYKIPILES